MLLLCGSLRSGSVNQAALQSAQLLLPEQSKAEIFPFLAELPAFNPDDDRDPLHPVVADLRARIGQADALLICTPEYAGALPGAFKNLLDWTVGGGEMDQKPVGWLNTAGVTAPTGGADAHASLRTVLTYLGANIVEEACVRLPLTRKAVNDQGLLQGEDLQMIQVALTALMKARRRHPE